MILGVHDRQQPTAVQKAYRLKALQYNELYSEPHFRYDVALLQLDGIVEISNEVKPIALPPEGSRIAPGKICYVTGTILSTKYEVQV